MFLGLLTTALEAAIQAIIHIVEAGITRFRSI